MPYRFLHSVRIQNCSLNCIDFWQWNLWTSLSSKQLEEISLFHTNDDSVHNSPSSDSRLNFICLTKYIKLIASAILRWIAYKEPRAHSQTDEILRHMITSITHYVSSCIHKSHQSLAYFHNKFHGCTYNLKILNCSWPWASSQIE